MSENYEEIVEGETYLRHAPDSRHEHICACLHAQVSASVAKVAAARLLPPRSIVQLSAGTFLRPDLALITVATQKLWLVAEVVNSSDHRTDTVTKKTIYEDLNLPRLWMVDPRYNNVEVYHAGPYGLALKKILAGRETLNESLLPDFSLAMTELFSDAIRQP